MLLRPLRALVAVAALMFSTAWASATDFVVPKQTLVVSDSYDVIPAGKSVPLGEIVDLTVSKPTETVPYLTASSYEWKVLEQGKERKFKGEKANVWYPSGVKPKKQQAFCVVTHLYVVREKPDDPKSTVIEIATRTSFLYAEILIGDATDPVDPVKPDPVTPDPVTPDPTFTDGQFKLAKQSFEWSKKVTDAKARTAGAKALATSFRGIASAIKAGAIKDPKDVLAKTLSKNQSSLGDAKVDKKTWEAFFTALQDSVYDLYEKDTISTLSDFAVAWEEIAQGLEAVK